MSDHDEDVLDPDFAASHFEPVVGELRHEARLRGGGDHLDPEQVDAYTKRLMPAEVLETARWHVAQCPACAQMVLELSCIDEDLAEAFGSEEPEPLPESIVKGIRTRIRAEAEKDKDIQDTISRPASGRLERWLRHPALGWAAAAALAAVALTPFGDRDGTPSLGTVSLVLHDLALSPQRTAAEPFVLNRPADETLSALVITVEIFDPGARFEVTMHEEATGRRVLASEPTLSSGPDRFALALPRSQFPSGIYRLEVLIVRGDGRRQALPPVTVEILEASDPP